MRSRKVESPGWDSWHCHIVKWSDLMHVAPILCSFATMDRDWREVASGEGHLRRQDSE